MSERICHTWPYIFKWTTKLLWYISWRWVVPAIHGFWKSASQFGIICYYIRSQFCRVPFKQVECQSALGVQECNRLIWWEISSENLSKNNKTLRNSNSRSACLKAVSTTSPIYGIDARSKQFCNRCNTAGLEQNVWFCISTLQLDRSGNKQGSSGKCRSSDTSDTHVADAILVYSPTKNVYLTSIAFSGPTKPITTSPRRKTVVKNSFLKLAARKITEEPWKWKAISSNAAKLISMASRPSSIAGYESAWNKWVSWFCRQQIDQVYAPLSEILNYLSTMFEKSLQYRTINSHRSAVQHTKIM